MVHHHVDGHVYGHVTGPVDGYTTGVDWSEPWPKSLWHRKIHVFFIPSSRRIVGVDNMSTGHRLALL